jgi:uncharacterized protein (TIGR03437 family)
LALAALCVAAARGAAPSYSTASIANFPSYTLAPFAPGSLVTIFGTGLARSAQAGIPSAGYLPTEINYVRVYVSDSPAALYYVSEGQINFLMPSTTVAGPVRIRVVVEGSTGPEVTVPLLDAVPAMLPNPTAGEYLLAQHADGTLLTADSPAHPGDVVVIYLTGLGRTTPNARPGEIPSYAAPMVRLSDLTVSLGGVVMDPLWVKYAGLTPGFAGLYQINLALPGNLGTDPEIRVSVAGQSSPPGLKLYLH